MEIVLGHYQVTGGSAAAISASVEEGVRAGALSPGGALPPVRALAHTLGVSPATVPKAPRERRPRGAVETAGPNGPRLRRRPAAPRAALSPSVPPGMRALSTGEPGRR